MYTLYVKNKYYVRFRNVIYKLDRINLTSTLIVLTECFSPITIFNNRARLFNKKGHNIFYTSNMLCPLIYLGLNKYQFVIISLENIYKLTLEILLKPFLKACIYSVTARKATSTLGLRSNLKRQFLWYSRIQAFQDSGETSLVYLCAI